MENKPRRPWLAVLLTFLAPGLGHMYSGNLKRGFILLVLSELLWLVVAVSYTVIPPSRTYMLFTIVLLIAFIVFCILDAIIHSLGKREKYEPVSYNRWYKYIGFLVLSILLSEFINGALIAPFIIEPFSMPTGSMEPTLLVGDHLVVNKLIYRFGEPGRGDLVVFKSPENPEVVYIKRLIGMPGEIIEVKGHTVYIDGRPLEETYKQHINPGSISDHCGPWYIPVKGDAIEVTGQSAKVNDEIRNAEVLKFNPDGKERNNESVYVPRDQYFVIGDNRDNSKDSRYWGGVPRDYFLGKAFAVYWSFETPRGQYLRTTRMDRLITVMGRLFNIIGKTRWNRVFKVVG